MRHTFLSRGVLVSLGCSNKQLQNCRALQLQAFIFHSWDYKMAVALLDLAGLSF